MHAIRATLQVAERNMWLSTRNGAAITRNFSTSNVTCEVQKQTRLRIVDNSEIGRQVMSEGKRPRIIHVYNKSGIGRLGDTVLVAIKGEKRKGILVGLKQKQDVKVPRFESNNLVLIDNTGNPLGTRITVPIPYILRTITKSKTTRKIDYTKLLAIATKFV